MAKNTEETIYGYSKPRLASPKLKLPSLGQVVADLADDLGVPLLPHQKLLMDESLYVLPNKKFARSQVGAIMARQNGKTHVMRMRILAGLFVFGEKNIIAISQSRMLSLDTFRQVVDMAEGTAWTRKRIKRVSRTNGQEELEVYCHHYPKACSEKCDRVRKYAIKAATSESPRGATANLLWIDELREISPAVMAAATPLTRATDGQTYYTSNAGDDSSTVLNEMRQRALTFSSERLGWFEWSAASNNVWDIENWKHANPALGHTISLESLEDSAKFDNPDVFRTESLSIWINAIDSPFPLEAWDNGEQEIAIEDDLPTYMALDLSFSRDKAYLVTVQKRADDKLACFVHEWTGLSNIELASEIATLSRRFRPRVLAYDPNTAGFIAPQLARAGIAVAPTPWASTAFSIFCDQTLAAMSGGQIIHAGQEILKTHLGASARKPASDGGWRIARRASTNPISAAVALVMAVGHATQPQSESAIFVV
jgi:phage terminase large subunit-like protein